MGGFATVWAGQRDGAPVAVKISHVGTDVARDAMRREAAALRAVGAPPAPAVYAAGEVEQRAYIVMEELRGQAWTSARVDVASFVAVCRAVARVHAAGLVHCDLKPSNIWVEAGGGIRLLDFGLARPPGQAGSAGTPLYAAPEQLRGESVSPATDIYALGVLLYELLAERPPFVDAVEYGHLMLRPPPLLGCPQPLADAAMACLAKQPQRRPADVAALLVALDDSSTTAPVAETAQQPLAERRPFVLAAVETPGSAAAVAAALDSSGGFVVRQLDGRLVCAFDAADGDPCAAAEAFADRIAAEPGTRVALHVATCEVSRRRSGVPGVRLGDTGWIPADGSGVQRSDAFARARCPAAATAVAELVGRDALLDAIDATWTRCLDDSTRAFIVIAGEPGSGKSALAARLSELAAPRFDTVTNGVPAATTGSCVAIIDDADALADEDLDALERAVSASDRAVCAVVFCHPRLSQRRPHLGKRAPLYRHHELPELAADPARELMAQLLGVDYGAREHLDELVARAGHNPGAMVALAERVDAAGGVEVHADGHRTVRREVLARLPAAADDSWIAARQLDRLPDDVAALLRVAALCTPGFHADEVAAIYGGAVDPHVGLFTLANHQLVRRDGDGFRVASESLRVSLVASIPAAQRVELHRAALAYWHEHRSPRAHAAVAHHATGCGQLQLAADAHLRAAEDARRAHRYTAADAHYSAALDSGAALAPALAGRGAVRYRLDRFRAALDDLQRAEAATSDHRLRAAVLLEQATALDWMSRYDESAQRVSLAAPLVEATSDAPLRARLAMARGRSALRTGRAVDAIELLAIGAADGAAAADYDARVVSLLLLAPALVYAGRLDEAGYRFDEVIGVCSEARDTLHLGAAYGNRVALWSALGDRGRAHADLVRARTMARAVGHPVLERNTTYNLAEHMYWHQRELSEALALARHARQLQTRFVGSAVDDILLCARIRRAMDDLAGARDELAAARAEAPPSDWSDTAVLLARMLELSFDSATSPGAWAALLADAAGVMDADELAELERYSRS